MNKVKHLFNHAFLVTAVVCSLTLVGFAEQAEPTPQKLVQEKIESKPKVAIIEIKKCS